MGLIHGAIPQPIPGTVPQGKGRDRKGMEKSRLRLHASSLSEGHSPSMHGLAPLGRGQR